MIFSTKGIVLHRFKYTDSKIIAKIYTEEFGLQAYLIYGSSSKKAKQIHSLLQPLFIVEMEVYHNEKKELQKIKEISNHFPFRTLPFNFNKKSVSLFLSEFILKVIRENEADKDLFNFIQKSIQIFDLNLENSSNFHLIFLIKMCKFLGISPQKNYTSARTIFDLDSGKFVIGIRRNSKYIDSKNSIIFNDLLYADYYDKLQINNSERRVLLNHIIEFYTIHLGKPGKLNSLEVLKVIF